MKYFTVEIKTVNEVTSQAIFERADLKAAQSAHHLAMASALADTACSEVMSMIIDTAGIMYERVHWSAAEPDEV